MKRVTEGETYFTPKQAAEYFNLSLSTIKNYIYAGELKTLKTPGGHHRISKTELFATLGVMPEPKAASPEFYTSAVFIRRLMLAVFNALDPAAKFLCFHAQSVAELSYKTAKAMGIEERDARRIEIAGFLHDIGHIYVDKDIILKPGPLLAEEYEVIKNHPKTGYQILSSIKELNGIAGIIVQHHERIDGKGYPEGLDGRDIKTEARIISVAEAYDSIVSERSYKGAVSMDKAIKELIRQKNMQFDPEIVDIFIKNL